MNELNARLKQLALTAQQSPAKSQNRRLALAKLIKAILKSGRLCRPHKGKFRGFYEDIYAEAQQKLFCYICENIDKYNPQYDVLAWVNFLFAKRFFIEASREVMPKGFQRAYQRQATRLTLEQLEQKTSLQFTHSSTPSILQEVIDVLQEDPEGIFQSTHIVNQPVANFKFLALKVMAGYSWKEISNELGIKISTLNSFYQRCLVRFGSKFREYVIIN